MPVCILMGERKNGYGFGWVIRIGEELEEGKPLSEYIVGNNVFSTKNTCI